MISTTAPMVANRLICSHESLRGAGPLKGIRPLKAAVLSKADSHCCYPGRSGGFGFRQRKLEVGLAISPIWNQVVEREPFVSYAQQG